ncbi:MAG: prenyltransferase/squalene oxidase repeat-containing protein [Planctomycetota bacterium]
MRSLLVPVALLAILPFASTLQAQGESGGSVPDLQTPGAQITANARWVYVLLDGQLHQFDAETLELKRTVPIPRAGTPAVLTGALPGIAAGAAADSATIPNGAEAIAAGLKWLRDHQHASGRWSSAGFWERDPKIRAAIGRDVAPRRASEIAGAGSPVHDVATTSIALLAMLADGSTMTVGPNKDSITKGVEWLTAQQDPDTGLVGARAAHDYIYDHAIATVALCEAGGLSGNRRVLSIAQKAVDYLEYHRNPYSVWRYEPKSGENDTSITGWCTLALVSANFFDLNVNPSALQLAMAWIDEMTDPTTGRTGYLERGGRSSRKPGDHTSRFPRDANETMTAVGLITRIFATSALDEPFDTWSDSKKAGLNLSANLVAEHPPVWDQQNGTVDFIGWYFGTYAMFQLGGERWTNWNRAVSTALLQGQRDEPGFAGSWDPAGPWGPDGGRVMSTALATLTLQANYRFTRLVRDR